MKPSFDDEAWHDAASPSDDEAPPIEEWTLDEFDQFAELGSGRTWLAGDDLAT